MLDDTTFPVLNLNGTSCEELIRQHNGVRVAAQALVTALAEACPHGRDYPGSGGINSSDLWAAQSRKARGIQGWADARLVDLMQQDLMIREARRSADRVDGYDRDDLGESPDF